MFGHLAADFDHVLLLKLGNVVGKLADDTPVLAKHLQATGALLQFGSARQPEEMALERALAVAVLFGQGGRRDRGQRAVLVELGGLVEQQGDRFRRDGLGIRVEYDLLVADLELRFVDDFTIYRDPAALDEQLSLPTGTADQLDKAFGKTNGFRHGKSRCKQ
ncbi:hypothetical protein D9M71_465420 [compost metagenome]